MAAQARRAIRLLVGLHKACVDLPVALVAGSDVKVGQALFVAILARERRALCRLTVSPQRVTGGLVWESIGV
jgi:hypothetical protein